MSTHRHRPDTRFSFALYRDTPSILFSSKRVWLRQLCRVKNIMARAENSGCEGIYVEVAKWNFHSNRWERFAFHKFFGGELWEDLSAVQTAVRVAAIINRAAMQWDLAPSHHKQPRRYENNDGQWVTYSKTMPVSVCEAQQVELCSFIHSLPPWNPTRLQPQPA